jgi:hypothetical protein
MKAPFEETPGTRELRQRAAGRWKGARPVGALLSARTSTAGYGRPAVLLMTQTRPAAARRRVECRCALRIGGPGAARRRRKRLRRDHSCRRTCGSRSTACALQSGTGARLAASRAYIHAERADVWLEPRGCLGPHCRDRGRSRERQSHLGRFGCGRHLGVARPRRHVGPARFAPLTTGAIVFDRSRRHCVLQRREGNWWARLGAGVCARPTVAPRGRRCDGALRGDGVLTSSSIARWNHLLAGTNGLFSHRGSDLDGAPSRRTGSLTPASGPAARSLRAATLRSQRHDGARFTARRAASFDRLRWLTRSNRPSHAPSARLVRPRACGARCGGRGRRRAAERSRAWWLVSRSAPAPTLHLGIEVYRGDCQERRGLGQSTNEGDRRLHSSISTWPSILSIRTQSMSARRRAVSVTEPRLNGHPLNRGLAITEIGTSTTTSDFTVLLGGTQDNGHRYGEARCGTRRGWRRWNCGVGTKLRHRFPSAHGMGMGQLPEAASVRGAGSGERPGRSALFYPPLERTDHRGTGGPASARNNGTNWTAVALPAGCV